MTIDIEDLFNSITTSFGRMDFVKPEDIPQIDLYMDQVTTFIDEKLKPSSREKYSSEKLMTKTMINNYAKDGVIPPPVKKKYTKEHILMLIMIYYYKSMLQINDIKDLMAPIGADFFGKKDGIGVEDIYREIFGTKQVEIKGITEDVLEKIKASKETFKDAPEESQDYLQMYAFVCMLGADVFVKKLLIEKVVDSMREHQSDGGNKYDMSAGKKATRDMKKSEKDNPNPGTEEAR